MSSFKMSGIALIWVVSATISACQTQPESEYDFDYKADYTFQVVFKDTSSFKNYETTVGSRLNSTNDYIIGNILYGGTDGNDEFTVTDIKNELSVRVVPKAEDHTATIVRMPGLNQGYVENPFKKTGKSAIINGYNCDEWLCERVVDTCHIWSTKLPIGVPTQVYLATVGPVYGLFKDGLGLPVNVIKRDKQGVSEYRLTTLKKESYLLKMSDYTPFEFPAR